MNSIRNIFSSVCRVLPAIKYSKTLFYTVNLNKNASKLPSAKDFKCLEHASSLILTCFEYDLGMFENLI